MIQYSIQQNLKFYQCKKTCLHNLLINSDYLFNHDKMYQTFEKDTGEQMQN